MISQNISAFSEIPPPPPRANKFSRGATLQVPTNLAEPLLQKTDLDNPYITFAQRLGSTSIKKTFSPSPAKLVPEYTQIIEGETADISSITNARQVANTMKSNITDIINTKMYTKEWTEAVAVDISKKWKLKIDEILEDPPFMMDEDDDEKITREKITKLKNFNDDINRNIYTALDIGTRKNTRPLLSQVVSPLQNRGNTSTDSQDTSRTSSTEEAPRKTCFSSIFGCKNPKGGNYKIYTKKRKHVGTKRRRVKKVNRKTARRVKKVNRKTARRVKKVNRKTARRGR